MKSVCGLFTVYPETCGSVYHTTTAKAAVSLAAELYKHYEGRRRIFILVDRGQGNDYRKIEEFGEVSFL